MLLNTHSHHYTEIILYLLYLCPYLCRIYVIYFFISSLSFIVINHKPRLAIIILRYMLYLVYLCPYLGLGIFMSYLWDLFFIFSLIFIVINRITSFKQTYLFFVHFLECLPLFLDNNVHEESE